MSYKRFNLLTELRKFVAAKPMKADAATLLHLVADDYLSARHRVQPLTRHTRPLSEKDVFTVSDVAAMTGWSRQTIIRMFQDERGTLIRPTPERLHKRGYRSIRIPRFVYERVIGKVSV